MTRLSLRLAFLLACVAPVMRAAVAADPLPKAETVLDDYVTATGGKAAYEKLKNRVAKGTIEVTGAGIKGTIEIKQAPPAKMNTVVDLGQLGKTIQGTNGEVAWDETAITGNRVLEGEEKEAMIRQAAFDSEIHWKSRYEKAECVAVEDVAGKPAFKIVLTPKSGKPVTQYYDKATKLIVKSVMKTIGPSGELTIESFPSDFKKVDGVLMPMVAKQQILTQEVVIAMTEIKHNVELPADAFKIPAAIQELLDKAKKTSK